MCFPIRGNRIAAQTRLAGGMREACERIAEGAVQLLCGRGGQSTVEAAFALPVLMLLALMLLQPGIVLYDRVVMQGAAAEGCRLIATSGDAGSQANEDFVRRRLGAIPQLDQFHVHSGGCTWRIEFSGGEGHSLAGVRLATELKPLPLLDFGMTMLGMTNASGNLTIEVESEQQMQPGWIEGSAEGSDPSGWVGI